MPIKLRPHSEHDPTPLENSRFQELVQRREGGWSHCQDEEEWLAKLHYLRQGVAEGKLTEADFREREARLVEDWIRRQID